MRLLMFFAFVGVLACHAQSDTYFLPSTVKASVSFDGVTQAGRGIHRLEVRRLAHMSQTTKKEVVTQISCVVYFAGEEHCPSVLRRLDSCIDPLVRKVSDDTVEIYFLAGTHTHIRQRWKLLGQTAKLEKEEEISWRDDPRMKEKPNQVTPAERPAASRSGGGRVPALGGMMR